MHPLTALRPVAAHPLERAGVALDEMDDGTRMLVRDGKPDRASAGAQVDDKRARLAGKFGEYGVDKAAIGSKRPPPRV